MKLITKLAAIILFAQSAMGADIFVREARGYDFAKSKLNQATTQVKRAVRRMPEHTLVQSERMADFVVQPSLVHDGDQVLLRIEKFKDGEVLSQKDLQVQDIASASEEIFDQTEDVLQTDRIAENSNEVWPGVDAGNNNNDETISGSSTGLADTSSSDSSTSASGGDIRAPSPAMMSSDRVGYFQFGVGPSFSTGLSTDRTLYDLTLGYIVPATDMISGKAFVDANLADGSDASRFVNFGVGAEVFPWGQYISTIPYVVGDVGYAFTRDSHERSADGAAVGAGAGFKFAANQLNMDVNLHYSLLTAQLNGTNPSLLGLRAAINF